MNVNSYLFLITVLIFKIGVFDEEKNAELSSCHATTFSIKDSLEIKTVRVYDWINTTQVPFDYFQLDEYSHVLGPVKNIQEYVTDEKDSLKQILRAANYDSKGRIQSLRYYYGNSKTSEEIKFSRDAVDYYWENQFEYGRKRLKKETRVSREGNLITTKQISKANSFLNFQRPKIIRKDRKTGQISCYSRHQIHSNSGPETVFCEYDTLGRKTKEIVKDSVDKIRCTHSISYSESEILIQTWKPYQKMETRYQLDLYGNWIKKTITYPNTEIYGKQIQVRTIQYD